MDRNTKQKRTLSAATRKKMSQSIKRRQQDAQERLAHLAARNIDTMSLEDVLSTVRERLEDAKQRAENIVESCDHIIEALDVVDQSTIVED